MHELYELKEMLCKKLEEYGRKGEITASTLDVIDKLAHAVKNIGKIIEMDEESEYSGNYDGGRSYARGGNNMRGGGGRSYARGRNAQRDSRGRYSGDIREMAMSLGEMMGDLPDELKGDAERFIRKLDSMM